MPIIKHISNTMCKLLILTVFCIGCCVSSAGPGLPVLLIPGNGGNQLEARLTGEHWANREACPNTGTWFRLWADVWQLSKNDRLQCFADMMELVYDPARGRSVNSTGVEVRVPGFGDTATVEYIDPSWSAYVIGNVGSYFKPLVAELESWGYRSGVDVRGAPYDFRLAPGSLPDYHVRLRGLIENLYREGGGRRVVVVAHSAGGLLAHYFLSHQTQRWKDTHIQTLVSLGTPWRGTPLELRVLVSGFNMDIPIIDSLTVRAEQRSSEVNILMLPKPQVWRSDQVLVTTPHSNYTLDSMQELFEDIGFPVGNHLMRLTSGPDYTFDPPGTRVECWYATGVDTPESFVYPDGFPDVEPSIVNFSDGDGTVPSKSAKACELWNNEIPRSHTVNTKAFSNLNHLQLIRSRKMFQKLKQIVYE